MAILSVSFVTLLQLFSGGIKSSSLSEQYLKAATLANSKLNELELLNYQITETSGSLEAPYFWSAEISPYDSPFNNEDYQVQLNKILLTIAWKDGNDEKNIQVTSLFLEGESYPKTDAVLKKLFLGGTGTVSAADGEAPAEETGGSDPSTSTTPATSTTPTSNICGATTTGTFNISGATSTGSSSIGNVTIGVP
jgi:general secretion pathway protein I